MKKLLVICGPTATGKTNLAIKFANKLNGEIVSADSRQVYKEMDIGTGKDLSKNSKVQISLINGTHYPYYAIGKIKLWGYDLVDPKEEFSVSQYVEIARNIILNIWKSGKLPILVGGTGFYIKGVIDGFDTTNIPKDNDLRNALQQKSTEELFEILAADNPIKAASLNLSDKKNPRRLIRAIEVSKAHIKINNKSDKFIEEKNIKIIGLKEQLVLLESRIKKRVKNRIKSGQEKEILKLLEKGVSWKSQSMQALGYKLWEGFFRGDLTLTEIENRWTIDEIKYAKRQLTWFKKDQRIIWFDASSPNLISDVEKEVKKWQND